MASRNISILTLCQTISGTGSMVLVTLGGIIGSRPTDDRALATLPISVGQFAVEGALIFVGLYVVRHDTRLRRLPATRSAG